MFRRKPTESDVQEIRSQVESLANRLSEFSKKLEERNVDIQTNIMKELHTSIDEVRTNLESISLELNNQVLDLSSRIEKIDQNTNNWVFSINDQIENFHAQYVNVLEELRQAKNIAVEKEAIMTKSYQELVEQLKEKEKLTIEKEKIHKERMDSLQNNIDKRENELEETRGKLTKLEEDIQKKIRLIDDLESQREESKLLNKKYKELQDEFEIQKYELERAKAQIEAMGEESHKAMGISNAVKIFLGESDSGRILSQLIALEVATIDEIASMTSIATYTVHQIVTRFRDLGILTFENGTRRVRIVH
ncbi:hypothetical protein [Candidatus Hodarchaeum mangrovi]